MEKLEIKPLKLMATHERWPLQVPFRTATRTVTIVDIVAVSLISDNHIGRGEASGIPYKGETPASILAQLEAVRPFVEAGMDRESLSDFLPAGGARNALDCAFWDLTAKICGSPAWQSAGLKSPRAITTMFGCGADTPDAMAAAAAGFAQARAIKLKLTGEPEDAARVRAVREARGDVELMIDANRSFTLGHLQSLLPDLLACSVSLIEQPFPIGDEALLDGLSSPIPIAADESAQILADLPTLAPRFDVINIKLDKCGGLTEALEMARYWRSLGKQVMVGNMFGTSLGMAPACLLAQLCSISDLDGPLFLAADRTPAATYEAGRISIPRELWGYPEEAGRNRHQ